MKYNSQASVCYAPFFPNFPNQFLQQWGGSPCLRLYVVWDYKIYKRQKPSELNYSAESSCFQYLPPSRMVQNANGSQSGAVPDVQQWRPFGQVDARQDRSSAGAGTDRMQALRGINAQPTHNQPVTINIESPEHQMEIAHNKSVPITLMRQLSHERCFSLINQSIHFPFLFNFIVAIFNLSFHLSSPLQSMPHSSSNLLQPNSILLSHLAAEFPICEIICAIVLPFCSVQFNDCRSGFCFAGPRVPLLSEFCPPLQSLFLASFPNFSCQFSVFAAIWQSQSLLVFAVSLPSSLFWQSTTLFPSPAPLFSPSLPRYRFSPSVSRSTGIC